MLGIGYFGGLVYLVAYLCLTKGWISGTGYTFHSVSVVSCILIAFSSGYSSAWPSALMNIIFVGIGASYLARKALRDAKRTQNALVDASKLEYKAEANRLEAAA